MIEACDTPARTHAWLRSLPYNWEDSFRTFRGVVRHGTANCMEAMLTAATIMEQHGHPPLVLDIESWDGLDHVLLLYRGRGGRWGTIAKSRDAGLHGRKAVFRTVRDLVFSYADPYVDRTGRVIGYGVFPLDDLTRADWRLGGEEIHSVERALIAAPHHKIGISDRRYERLHRRYLAFKERTPDKDPGLVPGYYRGRDRWL